MRRYVVLLAAVLVVAGAWSSAWFFGASQIRAAVEGLGETSGEAGPKLSCGRLNVAGFPFRFDIECAEATLVSGDVTATLAGMKASLLAYNPTQAKLSWLAPITYADAFSGARGRVDFTGAQGSVNLTTGDLLRGLGGAGWRIERVSLVADDVAWTDTVLEDRLTLSAAHLEAHLLDMPERHDAGAGTAALAAYAQLSEATAPGIGIEAGEASLEAELTGLPDDLRALAEPDVLRQWQRSGGRLNLVGLTGAAGEEFVDSSGTFGLDGGGRVDGQIVVRSKGLAERLGQLLPDEWRFLILGGPEPDGSYSQTLNIRAGVVFSGLVPISMIPPLF